jgi:hypothetical protein
LEYSVKVSKKRKTDKETERQRDRETERQRDRETERQRDRETERQRDRETERQRERTYAARDSDKASPIYTNILIFTKNLWQLNVKIIYKYFY